MERNIRSAEELAEFRSQREYDKDLNEYKSILNDITNQKTDVRRTDDIESYDNHLFGGKVYFPSIKYKLSKLKNSDEYIIVNALKNDFERWKKFLPKLPNSKEENKEILRNLNSQIELISQRQKEGIDIDKYTIRFIFGLKDYVKTLPEECRLENQYKVKNELKNLIINEINEEIKKVLNHYLIEVCKMIDPENKNINELIYESEPIEKKIKRPDYTHNQQFALLESLGVIDYLKNEYNLPDTKMSELIANIINRDVQNTRIMLSNTGNKECESKKQKNKDIVDPILLKTGVIMKD